MFINALEYLERCAQQYPEKEALGDDKCCVTYSEYLNNAKRIGSELIRRNNGEYNKPIAVLIDRNIESVMAFMGILYSGNFYVPIDFSMPKERIELILNTLKPIDVIDARPIKEGEYTHVSDILNLSIIDEDLIEKVRENAIDTDPIYTLFTSGSTGVPKGVTITHRGVIDLVEAFQREFGFDKECIFGNQAPFDFDVSTKDIYLSLMCGAKMQIIPKKMFMIPKPLLQYLYDFKINTIIWSVSALRILADFKALGTDIRPDLRYVMMCGEVMPIKALNYWMDHYPNTRYVNLYGPTEITCNCTFFEVKRRYETNEFVPIGKSFRNMRVLLLDENKKQIKEKNVVGEIHVGGTGLALGYWNNPEKTASSFIQNPLINEVPSRLYATGDMAYYNDDNDLVFAARRDFQIKHMGHRIELGEVEAALNSIPFIDVACCLYNEPVKKIVCFYQAREDRTKDVIEEMLKKLPKYMCPNQYIYFEKLPLNAHSKIDRQKLIKEYF